MENTAKSDRPILIVDDDLDTARSFSALVRHLGYDTAYVTNAELVLEVAKTLKPSLIFLDLAMPSITGWELAPQIRRELGEAARIVAVSGWADPEHHKRSREAGFDAHVAKPVDLDLLRSILAQIPHPPRQWPPSSPGV